MYCAATSENVFCVCRSADAALLAARTRRDRIDSLPSRAPGVAGLVSSLSQGHGRKTSQPHLSLPPARGHSQHPASRTRARDLQGQAVRSADAPSARARQPSDLERRQFLGLPGHGGPFCLPLTYPHKIHGIHADLGGRRGTHILVDLPMKKAPFGASFRVVVGGAGGIRTLDAGFAHILP